MLIDVNDKKVLVGSKWTAHTSRVNSLSFSPEGTRIASGGLDESVYIWSVQKTLSNMAIKVRIVYPSVFFTLIESES